MSRVPPRGGLEGWPNTLALPLSWLVRNFGSRCTHRSKVRQPKLTPLRISKTRPPSLFEVALSVVVCVPCMTAPATNPLGVVQVLGAAASASVTLVAVCIDAVR